MLRKYEGLIALNTKNQKDGLNDLVSEVAKEMENCGAKMDEIKQLGHRKFAYNARQIEGAHYVNYIFEIAPEDLQKIESNLKLNSMIYLQHYQRLN